MEKNNRKLGALALLGAAVGVGGSATLNRLSLNTGMPPLWLNAFRLGFAILLTLPFFLRDRDARRAVRTLRGRDLHVTLLAGLMLAIHFATWVMALAHADSLVATAVWSTFSLMTVIGSSLMLREKTPLPAVIGIAMATVGVGVCTIGAGGSQAYGVLMAAIAAVSQAVYTLCGRSARKRLGLLPYTMTVYTVALLLIVAAALSLSVPTAGITAAGVGWAALLAFVSTIGGHSMQNYALRFFKAPVVSAVIMTEVFTGPLLTFAVLGEVPRPVSMIGGLIILLSVGWVMYNEWRNPHGAVRSHGKAAQHPGV